MNKNTLTILICTHNRRQLLLRTLSSLYDSVHPTDWFVEVLVVINACTDDTKRELIKFIDNSNNSLPTSWLEEPNPGKSFALNLALPRIESEIVAFVDDDHRVDRNYISNICGASIDNPKIELFCGRILPDWDGTEPVWVHDNGRYRIYPLPVPRFDQGDMPIILDETIAIPGGGNLIIRTELLNRVGLFSIDLGPSGHSLQPRTCSGQSGQDSQGV